MMKNENIKIFDFSWGNPYFLLEILNGLYRQKLNPYDIKNMVYGPDAGFDDLRRITKKIIKQTTGLEYKHVIITNGATHGINIVLQLLKRQEAPIKTVVTTQYGYPFYEDMIKHKELGRKRDLLYGGSEKFVRLIDSPSNPEGQQVRFGDPSIDIWDAVYHNEIYTNDLTTYPAHHFFISSYSKLLGVTGARVGFVATNNMATHLMLKNEILKDLATISVPSQRLIVDILEKVDINRFTGLGKAYLNYNREEFQKIEYLFDNQRVQEKGMFYCAFADKKCLELLEKCGINYVSLGENYIRLSLGQTGSVTRAGIKTILKEDGK